MTPAEPRHLVETIGAGLNYLLYAVVHGPIPQYTKSRAGFKSRPVLADDPRSDGEIISVARKIGAEAAVKPVVTT